MNFVGHMGHFAPSMVLVADFVIILIVKQKRRMEKVVLTIIRASRAPVCLTD